MDGFDLEGKAQMTFFNSMARCNRSQAGEERA